MKIYRFRHGTRILMGVLRGELLFPVKGSIFSDFTVDDCPIPIGDVKLLPPVLPTKIVCVGANYRDHAAEMSRPVPSEPLLFLKPPSALIGPFDAIVYPEMSQRIDYEGELALVMGKTACRLSEDRAMSAVLGFSCFNDVTARDLQKKDIQFTRAKSFDTFAVLGPCIRTDFDPAEAEIKTFLNGRLKQSGHGRQLIFSPAFLVSFISRIMTLYPGDVIATGTPAGVGPMAPGDRVDIRIEGIGTLSNEVIGGDTSLGGGGAPNSQSLEDP